MKNIINILLKIWAEELSINEVGIDDNFIGLGGNSLAAIRITLKIEKELNVECTFSTIFKKKTIRKLATYLLSQKKATIKSEYYDNANEIDSLSSMQTSIYFLDKKTNSPLYNEAVLFEIKGSLKISILEKAANTLIKRHRILQTNYVIKDKKLSTVMSDHLNIKLTPQPINQKNLKHSILAEINKKFSLDVDPLIRFALYELSPKHYFFVITQHHIITDDWSIDVIKQEISILYSAYLTGKITQLPKLKSNYCDFVSAQQNYIKNSHYKKSLQYWKNKLNNFQRLDLATDFSRKSQKNYISKSIKANISKKLFNELRKFSKKNKFTPFTIFSTAMVVLLSQYSRKEDIVFGFPVSQRNNMFKNVLGLFINTLVLRTVFSDKNTVNDLLIKVRSNCYEAYEHQDIPFNRLVTELKIQRGKDLNPIFDVMFVWHDMRHSHLSLPKLEVEEKYIERKTAKFDITFEIFECEDSIEYSIEYNASLYSNDTILRLSSHFNYLIETIIYNENAKIKTLSLLSSKEAKRILALNKNRKTENYFINKSLDAYFTDIALKQPNNIACEFNNKKMTYGELNKKSDLLAVYIISQLSDNKNKRIALYLPKNISMIIAMLAVLKSGAAYIPIDIRYPQERIEFIIKDAACQFIILQNKEKSTVAFLRKQLIVIDAFFDETKNFPQKDDIYYSSRSNDLAYIMYTSGTTGKPKGVLQTHQNVLKLFSATQKLFNFNAEDRWTLFHSYVFDFSVWEIWGALLYGGILIIPSDEQIHDPYLFYQLIQEKRITILNQTPSAFKQFSYIDSLSLHKQLYLRFIIFGGERLDHQLILDWWKSNRENYPRLVNMYGITETTVHTTYKLLKRNTIKNLYISNIGHRLPHIDIYVVNKNLKLVPVGVPGELLVGRNSLAIGYLNQPSLTAEKFIEDPFITDKERIYRIENNIDTRVYKSGDLVKWLPNGELAYLERIDSQVKIRGFRIELRAIENSVRQHPNIRECIALVEKKQDNDKIIVFYIVKDKTKERHVNSENLRVYIQKKLPFYMVPHLFIAIKNFPLTQSMKIDTEKLFLLKERKLHFKLDNKAKTHPDKEEILLNIWKKILNNDTITATDNFFSIGGDSITCITITNEAKAFGFNFSIADIFKYQTIRELVNISLVENAYSTCQKDKPFSVSLTELKNKNIQDIYAQSRLQSGMLYHTLDKPNSAIYLDIFRYTISGTYNFNALSKALELLTYMNPILRTSFDFKNYDRPMQIVYKNLHCPISEIDLSMFSTDDQQKQLAIWESIEKVTFFDIKKAPLWRITIHKLSEFTFDLGLSFHHAILDGWSVSCFMTELLNIYSKVIEQKFICLKQDNNYKLYIQQEQSILADNNQKSFWENEIKKIDNVIIHNSLGNGNEGFHSKTFHVDNKLTNQLLNAQKKLGYTIDIFILTAHMKMLSILASQNEVTSGVVFHGRSEIEGIDKTLGLFLNVLPFHLNIKNSSWLELIKIVNEKRINLYQFRNYPLEKIIELNDRKPLFSILFYFTHFHRYKSLIENKTATILSTHYYERTNFPLAINFSLNSINNQLSVTLNYETIFYSDKLINTIWSIYLQVLTNIATAIDNMHTNINLINKKEEYHILINRNKTEAKQSDESLLNNFEESVINFTNKTAIIFNGVPTSYSILNEKINQFSSFLRNKGLSANDKIVVMMPRSDNTIITVLSIFKIGATYVPIDINHPIDRITFILDEIKPNAIIIDSALNFTLTFFNEYSALIITYDNVDLENISKCQYVEKYQKDAIAYILYTSGSTGVPKGVAIKQCSLVNILLDFKNRLQLDSQDHFLALTSFSFDISMLEVFLPLLTGAKCVIASEEQRTQPKWLIDTIKKESITVMQSTPTMWQLLIDYGWNNNNNITILSGGEALSYHLANKLITLSDNVWNLYGPTETTIWSTATKLSTEMVACKNVTIGKPIANTKVYVLNSTLKPVPDGITGELYIAGEGVAKGYFNRNKLTQEKFINNPFIPISEKYNLLYKTGDRVQWSNSGLLYYIGRSDQQIKLRGYRIECEEIEFVLQQHEMITTAVVLMKTIKGRNHLFAYLMLKGDGDYLDKNQWERFLEKKLPRYMLPEKYLILKQFPQNQNGKIDKKKLLSMDVSIEDQQNKYTAPKTMEEKVLANIWKHTLDVKQISRDDNFFDLGGNSLKSLIVMDKISEQFFVTLLPRDMIENPTLSTLAKKIHVLREFAKTTDNINQINREDIDGIPDPLIKLQSLNSLPPLFLIHPVGGTVFCYLPLVKALGKDRQIYAIQDAGIDAHRKLFTNLFEMARFYIKVIKQYQAAGPYFLAGSSFGGNLAVEIGRQLINNNEEIRFLGLFDSWAKYPDIANQNREWFEANQKYQIKFMQAQFPHLEFSNTLLDLNWHRQQLLVQYQHYNLKNMQLTLFKSENTMDILVPMDAKDNNWFRYCQTKPTVYKVPGDHFSMHFSPNVEILAVKLKDHLNQIDKNYHEKCR